MLLTVCRETWRGRLLDRSCKRLGISIVWVQFMEVCFGSALLVVQPAKYVCLRSTSRQHRSCRREDLEDVCRGCTTINRLA
jgi:hypothetical protein